MGLVGLRILGGLLKDSGIDSLASAIATCSYGDEYMEVYVPNKNGRTLEGPMKDYGIESLVGATATFSHDNEYNVMESYDALTYCTFAGNLYNKTTDALMTQSGIVSLAVATATFCEVIIMCHDLSKAVC